MSEENYMIILCPNCNDQIIIDKTDVNCGIFRHGYFINTQTQINPHTSEEDCNNYLKSNNVIGCCKPFMLINNIPQICGYI